MNKKNDNIQEAEILENKDEKAMVAVNTELAKPENDTKFAHEAAKILVDIVKQNGWSRKLGGQSEHLQYEAWQTVGKYYGYTVDTDKQAVEYVMYGNAWGFKAHAEVIDNKTGLRVGGASALCMSDETNWRNKPKFQLMSMAQTRAGSKALRQILGFVVALAGYNPTPAEEMDGVNPASTSHSSTHSTAQATDKQLAMIRAQLNRVGKTEEWLNQGLQARYKIEGMEKLDKQTASTVIEGLLNMPAGDPDQTLADEVEKGMKN